MVFYDFIYNKINNYIIEKDLKSKPKIKKRKSSKIIMEKIKDVHKMGSHKSFQNQYDESIKENDNEENDIKRELNKSQDSINVTNNGYPLSNVIIPRVSETIVLMKIGSFLMILILSLSFILVQFYNPNSNNFKWVDGIDAIYQNINLSQNDLFYHMKKNIFTWPEFIHSPKKFEICFIIGLVLVLTEYFILFGFKFLRWYQTLPLFLLKVGGPNANFSMEKNLSKLFAYVSWVPFRGALNLMRTGLELSYQEWQIHIMLSTKEVTVEDKTGCKTMLVPKYDMQERIIYSIVWCIGSLFLLIPIHYTLKKPFIKIFDNTSTEEDIRAFSNDEIALCYQGIEIQNNKLEILDDDYENEIKSKTFEDLLGSCIWFKKINLSRAKKIKIDLYKLSIDFMNFEEFKLHAIYGKFEDFLYFKNVKSIQIQEGEEKLDYASALALVGNKFPNCYMDVIFMNGRTLLHRAASIGDHETTKLLQKHKSNIEAQDIYGATPLLTAAYESKATVVKVLAESFADVEAMDKLDRTPLLLAAWNGHAECLGILLDYHAEPDVLTDDGSTPLHKAAHFGYDECVKLLIEHAADIEIENEEQHTPLHEAVVADQDGCVKLLLEALADTEAVTIHGRTPLLMAAGMGFEKSLKLLLEHNADTESKNNEGCTPLFLAAAGDYDDCIDLLVKHGADIEALDEANMTPLMMASEKGKYQAVAALLRHGADTTAQDMVERTAADIAREAGHLEIVELIEKGPPPKITKKESKKEKTNKSAKNGMGSSLINNIKESIMENRVLSGSSVSAPPSPKNQTTFTGATNGSADNFQTRGKVNFNARTSTGSLIKAVKGKTGETASAKSSSGRVKVEKAQSEKNVLRTGGRVARASKEVDDRKRRNSDEN
jgi:ankyrin repeat protein